jgi:hypothetical protein
MMSEAGGWCVGVAPVGTHLAQLLSDLASSPGTQLLQLVAKVKVAAAMSAAPAAGVLFAAGLSRARCRGPGPWPFRRDSS